MFTIRRISPYLHLEQKYQRIQILKITKLQNARYCAANFACELMKYEIWMPPSLNVKAVVDWINRISEFETRCSVIVHIPKSAYFEFDSRFFFCIATFSCNVHMPAYRSYLDVFGSKLIAISGQVFISEDFLCIYFHANISRKKNEFGIVA